MPKGKTTNHKHFFIINIRNGSKKRCSFLEPANSSNRFLAGRRFYLLLPFEDLLSSLGGTNNRTTVLIDPQSEGGSRGLLSILIQK